MGSQVTLASLRSGLSLIDWDKLVADVNVSGDKARSILNPSVYAGSLYLYIYPSYYATTSKAEYIAINCSGQNLALNDQAPAVKGSISSVDFWSNIGNNAEFLFSINFKSPIGLADFLSVASKRYDSTQKVFNAEGFIGDLNIVIPTASAYKVTPSADAVNEGDVLTTTVSTTGVPSGTTLYWALSGEGIDTSDFTSGALLGSGKVNDKGTFSFRHVLNKDGSSKESKETLEIKLFSDQQRKCQVGDTAKVAINDTSVAPAISYQVLPSSLRVREGDALTTKLIATGLPNAASLQWKVISVKGIDELDLSLSNPNRGFKKDAPITIGQESLSPLSGFRAMVKSEIPLVHYVLADKATEGDEAFRIGLYDGVTLVAQSPVITVEDASRSAAPIPKTDPVTGQVDDYRSSLAGALPWGLINSSSSILPNDKVVKVASGSIEKVGDSDWFDTKNLRKITAGPEAYKVSAKWVDGPNSGKNFDVKLRNQKGESIGGDVFKNLQPMLIEANPGGNLVGKYDLFLEIQYNDVSLIGLSY